MQQKAKEIVEDVKEFLTSLRAMIGKDILVTLLISDDKISFMNCSDSKRFLDDDDDDLDDGPGIEDVKKLRKTHNPISTVLHYIR